MTEAKVVLDSAEAIQRHLRQDIEPESFNSNGVRFVLCDDRNRVLFHCHVGEVPITVSWTECVRTISFFAHGLAQAGDGAVLLALMRPGYVALTPMDRRWFRVARDVCADYAVRLLGVHIVTPRGQREVLLDDAL